tara:strand:+ start:4542 stop:5234 length:693 start_codon:yes stop_codon:yes gene_type:complete
LGKKIKINHTGITPIFAHKYIISIVKKVEICSNINIFIIIDLKMFHQKNKKKNLEMTIDEMRNFAFIYIEKYAPSKQQLKTYLLKKYLNSKLVNVSKKNISDLIEIVTEDLEKTKFINDKFYSETKAKSLIQKGSSLNKIRNYLMNKGVGQKYIKYTLEKISHNNDDQDFFSAIKICKKRRIGPARNENNRPLFYKKDMGILARSGFDFEVSKRVLDISKDEYLKIINLF